MLINYSQEHFINDGGYYYSLPFKSGEIDSLLTINVHLQSSGTTIVQSSIDGINWYDIEFTDFICTPSGLQSYVECQELLLYRLKTDQFCISAKILI